MALDCLSGLVGLSRRDCNCVSGGQPSGWSDSETGYYLDDQEYGFPLKDALDANLLCGESTIWTLLANARTQGIRDVKSDLLQSLNQVRESRVINWRGVIGKTDNVGSYISTNTYESIQLRPRIRMKDAYLTVKALWININQTKSVTVGISSNDGTFADVSGSASVTANTWTKFTFPTAQQLPLYSIAKQDLRYNVFYQPAGAQGRQNRLWCCSKPQWIQHLEAGTFSMAALPGDDVIPTHQEATGLAIEGYFTCNKLDWICDLEEMNGLEMRDLIGRLIQWKSSIHLITNVLRSGKINKFTLMNQEGLYRQRNHLKANYENTILWVSQHLPQGVTSCWGCERDAPQISFLKS